MKSLFQLTNYLLIKVTTAKLILIKKPFAEKQPIKQNLKVLNMSINYQ